MSCIIFCITTHGIAQTIEIHGRVIDAVTGTTLAGVSVFESGTFNGTATDMNGNYNIRINEGAELDLHRNGYVSKKVRVMNNASAFVAMEKEVEMENEVEAAYGTIEKRAITSAIHSAGVQDFNQGTIHNPFQLVQGRIAGLNVTRPGGDINGNFFARIRGLSSTQAYPGPLIVIDGFIGASLSTVDPADVASFSILKDAASASLYGARGANGVIVITTKSGSDKPSIDFHSSVAFENIARFVPTMSADEYRSRPNAIDYGTSTDWNDLITQTGISQVYNLALSGGSGNTSYRVSANYRNAEGTAVKSGFTQLNTRISLNQKAFNDRATFRLNFANTNRDISYGFPEAFRYAINVNPTMPVYNENETQFGGYFQAPFFEYYNPVAIVSQNIREGKEKIFIGGIHAEYDFSDFVQGLKAGVTYSHQTAENVYGEYSGKNSFYKGYNRNGLAIKETQRELNELFETTLQYNKALDKAKVSLLGGYSYQTFFLEQLGMEGGNFLTDAFTYNNMAAALDFANGIGFVSSQASSHTMISFFGRADLSIKDIYFFSLGSGYSGSSRLGANNKWGMFPSVGAAVVVSELIDVPLFEDFKVRVSSGASGNIPNRSYASLEQLVQGGSSYYNGHYNPSFQTNRNANPDLRWEAKQEFNLGFDFVLLNSRMNGSFDYFSNSVNGLLNDVTVPSPPNPAWVKLANVGKLHNRGFELTLSYNAVKKNDFVWQAGINLARVVTKMINLSNRDYEIGNDGVLYTGRIDNSLGGCGCQHTTRIKEGEKIGDFWGAVFDGITPDGNPKFSDSNGDGIQDLTVIGNALPDFTIGISNSISYKDFSLDFFMRGALGHYLLNNYRFLHEPVYVGQYNVVKTKYFDPKLAHSGSLSDRYVEKASYLRLDNITLSYNWPLNLSSSYVRSLRFYITAQNLFTLTGYTGADPEVRYMDTLPVNQSERAINNGNPLVPGIEGRNNFPLTRTFTFGVSLGF